jgi:hypothetical protein
MKNRNYWVLLIFILSGIVLGGLIGSFLGRISGFEWLNYGQNFGLENPIVLNLGILIITFGLAIKITIASIIGIILSIIAYRFV